MCDRVCANCVYAKRAEVGWLYLALRRWPAMRICSAWADAPGRTCAVHMGSVCRNFRPRPGVQITVPDDGGCRIPLTQGQFAIVDPENLKELSEHKWCAMRGKHTYYACRQEKGKTVFMHRQIMQTPPGMVVDHIDLNGLNNRVSNMRNCSIGANNCNSRPREGGTGFRGVCYDCLSGKYRAVIHHKGRRQVIGDFDDPVEAARARDRKAMELQGEFAYLNFPELRGTVRSMVSLRGTVTVRSSARARLTRRRERIGRINMGRCSGRETSLGVTGGAVRRCGGW
ncbi:hypothetical protein [Anaerobaca lacustris]|uniref:AP2/ERF domain-containing protein n=1 Tax=Anaerobaca lacustris TaxID=3044600 RepID=A0AAW6TY04_9BACT|nr:hypothetical protein [Sedimentisphaerales bacterium M17dextr]